MDVFEVKFPEQLKLTDEEFFAFCRENRHLRMEKTSNGEILIIAPTEERLEEKTRTLFLNLNTGTVKVNWEKLLTLQPVFH